MFSQLKNQDKPMPFTEQNVNLRFGGSFITITAGHPGHSVNRQVRFFLSGIRELSERFSRLVSALVLGSFVSVALAAHDYKDLR